ncbi:hypothetical protein [Psychroserpens ponticola]|uniref:DUF4397 domain-containing protein n=1 Tax=Psychroserpens ponticola TaxID=2932268 RepID=A0ABY7S2L2_9FLAO|nr:hypothetical protein [Psychroserpens ponticola]WCO03528.1 hypothetical protein MUN68_008470 [Psychroserpens ponticola]
MRKLLIFFIIFSLYSCSNDDDGTESSLPAITTEGKNTFGCKIDGETFLPRNNGGFSAGYTTVLRAQYRYYEYEYYGLEPGYHLAIRASNSLTDKNVSIELAASDEPIVTGQTYPIVLKTDGSISAEYGFSTNTQDPNNPNIYYYNSFNHITTDEFNGEITFNLVDEENQIISGVFYFTCINPETDEIVEVLDGRFDIEYDNWF